MLSREGGYRPGPEETQQIPGRGRDRRRELAPESEAVTEDIPRIAPETERVTEEGERGEDTARELLEEYRSQQEKKLHALGIEIAQLLADRGNTFTNEQELEFALSDLRLHKPGNEPAIQKITELERKIAEAINNRRLNADDKLLHPLAETLHTWVMDKGDKLPYVITYRTNREFDISRVPTLARFKGPSRRPPTLRAT